MSWSYGNDPANSELDAVRLLLGDTDINDQQLSDEELNYFISATSDVYSAAALASRSLASKYARLVESREVGDLKLEFGARYQRYLDLADQLEMQVAVFGASPFLGGNSVSDKETEYSDESKVQPYFARNQFDEDNQSDLPFETVE